MAIFKCKMCGGTIEFQDGATVGVCDSCGTKQTLPRLDSDRKTNLYDRANHFRRNNEFDKAMSIYENILNEDPTDAEAYWSLVLCRYGIEYVEDPATHKRLPTVNRAQFTSIFDDEDYKSALKNADALQRAIYEDEAKSINEIQKGILEISAKEEPFDVFICYKETDANGRRTPDSVLATDLYHQLTNEDFKVFFSRITLEDKLGQEYEPYIFAALNSAKAMVVLGTKPEHFNAVWVKNEWSRYLALIKAGAKKTLIPAYRDMDPYDLPDEFSHLQAQDMSKLGFMQDLIHGIKKIVKTDEPKQTIRETIVTPAPTAATAPLLRRAFMFLEDGEWQSANEYCEKVLDVEPENAEAYLGKLMAELKVRKRDDLKNQPKPFDDRNYYKKAVRFGDDTLKKKLTDDVTFIKDRNETARREGIYSNALALKNAGKFAEAKSLFESIADYKDAGNKIGDCAELIEKKRKDGIYYNAMSLATEKSIKRQQRAIEQYRTISGWKDADEQIAACEKRIEEIKAKEEADRIEAERKAEEMRIAAEKRKKKNKKIALIVAIVLAAATAVLILLFTVIMPAIRSYQAKLLQEQEYEAAVALYNAGEYEHAKNAFSQLVGYKDSSSYLNKCKKSINDQDYDTALALYNNGKYQEAMSSFKSLNGYKNSEEMIEKCQITIIDHDYDAALGLYKAGEYENAKNAFVKLNGYKDSEEMIKKCQTAITAIKDQDYDAALELYNSEQYEKAIAAFDVLNGYKDSEQQIEACKTAIRDQDYEAAIDLYNAGQYMEAIAAFEVLNGYKDSAAMIKEIKSKYHKEVLFKSNIGDSVFFGSYEQDNNTSNGKEAIEWLILAREGNRMLVISKYALDCQRYNTSYTNVTWGTCSLRKWLNGPFISNAFSSDEHSMIQTTTVTEDKSPSYITPPGDNTTTDDIVFLLSITEANKYFSSDSARQCQATAYAEAQGAYADFANGYCWWWLRSPGYFYNCAALVRSDGSANSSNSEVFVEHAVRPAMWIDLGGN